MNIEAGKRRVVDRGRRKGDGIAKQIFERRANTANTEEGEGNSWLCDVDEILIKREVRSLANKKGIVGTSIMQEKIVQSFTYCKSTS